MSTSAFFKNVINLGNSIIGVSILAMPYCFKRCGILMSILLIVASGFLTRAACHLLLKSAIIARRRNFEFLAFHILGSTGKLFVEIGILGFLLGTCVAFFVVIGDLAPSIMSEVFMIENNQRLRATILIFLAVFVALPLGMLRTLESLTSCSAASLVLYVFLILKIFFEAFPNLFSWWWMSQVNFWEPSGLLACLPIFSMALSCQTQLFEIFDTLNDPSLKRMNSVVSGAVNLCSLVYIAVGFFGYVAFCDQPITGNILVMLPPTFSSLVTKVGFVLTVVISYPLCLFPCRTSLHSLLFRRGMGHHDLSISYIPDHHFRLLTVGIVSATVGTALLLPSIEVVLGFIGSTIGTFICIILPAFTFMRLTSKNTNERVVAHIIFTIGIFIFVMCSTTTLKNASHVQVSQPELPVTENSKERFQPRIEEPQLPQLPKKLPSELAIIVHPSPALGKNEKSKPDSNKNWKPPEEKKAPETVKVPEVNKELDVKRQEPPVPHEPEVQPKRPPVVEPVQVPIKKVEPELSINIALDPDALKKEDKEIGTPKKVQDKEQKQEEIIKKLEAQHEEHKKIIEEHKQLLKELKMHKETHLEQQGKKEVPALPVTPKLIVPSSSSKPEVSPVNEHVNAPLETQQKIRGKPPEDEQVAPQQIAVQQPPHPIPQVENVQNLVPVQQGETKSSPMPIIQSKENAIIEPKVKREPKNIVVKPLETLKSAQAVNDPVGGIPQKPVEPKPIEVHKREVKPQQLQGAEMLSYSSPSYQNIEVPTTREPLTDTKKQPPINSQQAKEQNALKNEMRRLLEVQSTNVTEERHFNDSHRTNVNNYGVVL